MIMAPTFVDLFCGIGGFRIGLEAAGFECIYANDIDPTAVQVYKKNRLPGSSYPVECADIRKVFHDRLENIPRHHGEYLLLAPIPILIRICPESIPYADHGLKVNHCVTKAPCHPRSHDKYHIR